MTHLVAILAYDRLCMFEFGCAVELFALERPELGVDWYRHAVCAVEAGPLRGTGGVQVQAPYSLAMLRRADTIVVPGWRDASERPPQPLLNALRKAHVRGARICSICSGVFVLAHAGLLDGRRASTHWRYAQQLKQAFPKIEVDASALYVDEGSVITSAGSAAGLDMLMHLVRKDHGSAVANAVAQRLVMAPQREGGQAQFVPRPMPTRADSPMARLQAHLRAHPRNDHRVASLAQHVGMSERSLQRHFKASTGVAVMEWLVRERVALAKELLETHPDLDVEGVADLSGLGSPESLRRHFRRLGVPAPSRYRRQFA
ncbi:transcriptional regulator FtrA [Roseateles terrae]|uniref:AraC family transcriptional activator FtrA n=1 Tax=Roseateles terrae TaxID=431060 RepID=A0ABR6GYL6_9BURK|nr:transcriptional regulator FtrA [Roseateles terrae]MBB3197205.1 AraC family transcriptional activator FtrA [Roseateles terrae]OWQ83726.1 transcriptional regulator FtrA [Roseateles terrae]